jgi:hypothetical protein
MYSNTFKLIPEGLHELWGVGRGVGEFGKEDKQNRSRFFQLIKGLYRNPTPQSTGSRTNVASNLPGYSDSKVTQQYQRLV